MKKFSYYFTLMLYPLAFFLALGGIEYVILGRAYDAQEARRLEPYADGAPIPAVTIKADRRPQSIDIP